MNNQQSLRDKCRSFGVIKKRKVSTKREECTGVPKCNDNQCSGCQTNLRRASKKR